MYAISRWVGRRHREARVDETVTQEKATDLSGSRFAAGVCHQTTHFAACVAGDYPALNCSPSVLQRLPLRCGGVNHLRRNRNSRNCGGEVDRPQFVASRTARGWTTRRELEVAHARRGENHLCRNRRTACAPRTSPPPTCVRSADTRAHSRLSDRVVRL